MPSYFRPFSLVGFVTVSVLTVSCGDASRGGRWDTTGLQPQARFQIPARLNAGDRVSLIAPSSAIDAEGLEQAIQSVRDLGFEPSYRSDILDKDSTFAGSHPRRLAELQAALADPSTRAIWAVRGGYGATYLLPDVDIDVVYRAHKWLVGFSDVTALHTAWARAGMASLHGATAHRLAAWTPAARSELVDYLTTSGEHVLPGQSVGASHAATGFLTGGNLTLLASLAGTDYLPNWHGAIVLFEAINEAPYQLERSLLQLYLAGAFDGVRGIVLAQFCGLSLADQEDAVARITQLLAPRLDVPILVGISVGHEPSSRAVLFGANARLDPVSGTLTIERP